MRDDVLYIYSDHLYGNLFVADGDYENGICPQCGDTDTLEYVGTYDEILKGIEMDIEDLQREYVRVKELLDGR